MKLFAILALTLVACDFPIPDSGCATVTKVGNTVHVEYCDGGMAGEHAHGGVGGSVAGTGGAGHDSGSAGSSGAAGSAGGHMHGGLPVVLPLPAPKLGRTDFVLVSAGSRKPVRDAGGIGAARTRCYVNRYNFDDFIVYPGQPDLAHAHMYWGADKVDAFGIDPTSGGSCRGGAVNLSAYWAPALLTPEGKVIPPTYVDVYYKASHYDLNGTPFVNPPPKGLKLISGDMRATPSAPQNKFRFYFTCGETDDTNSSSGGLPQNCSNAIIGMHIKFPQCWDGKNLDSADHKSHVVFPVSGACPATHPKLIPSISQHVYFRNVPANSRLSCDGATGQGGFCLHSDLVVNWDEAIMQSMVTNCINTGLSCGSDLTGDGRSMDSFNGN